MSSFNACVVGAFCFVLTACTHFAFAQDEETIEKEKKNGIYVLEGIRQSRSQLDSGECACIGSLSKADSEPEDDRMVVEYSFAFEQGMELIFGELCIPQVNCAATKYKNIRRANEHFTWNEAFPRQVTLEAVSRSYVAGSVLPDVRVVGLANWSEMISGAELHQFINELRETSFAARLGDDGLWILVVDYPQSKISSSFVVDESKGFAVISGKTSMKRGRELPLVQSICDWKSVDGVWVPSRSECKFLFGEEWYCATQSFEWRRINQPISPASFEVEHMGLSPSTPIIDMRKNVPKAVAFSKSPLSRKGIVSVSQAKPSWIGLGVVNVGVAILLGGFLYRRNTQPRALLNK
jgi:hypothetical protein